MYGVLVRFLEIMAALQGHGRGRRWANNIVRDDELLCGVSV